MPRRYLAPLVRRELLCFLFAFIAVQLCLAVAVEHWLPDVRDAEYALKEERLRALRTVKPRDDLLVLLGSSRGSMGLQAGALNQAFEGRGHLVFNAALSGGGPVLDLICLRRLLAAGLRPDFVLIEVVPLHFNQADGTVLEERVLNGSRLRRSELTSIQPYWDDPMRQQWQWWKARLLPAFLQHAELREHLGIDTTQPGGASDDPRRFLDRFGWYPRYLGPDPPRQRLATAQALAQYAPYTRRFRPAPRPLQALNDLLAACRSEGVAVGLLMMPEATAFRRLYCKEVHDGIDHMLETVGRDWHVPLIDARTWVADAEFWDGHHLLPTGAAIFTQRLAGELRPYVESSAIGQKRVTRLRSSP